MREEGSTLAIRVQVITMHASMATMANLPYVCCSKRRTSPNLTLSCRAAQACVRVRVVVWAFLRDPPPRPGTGALTHECADVCVFRYYITSLYYLDESIYKRLVSD